jgi:hypothetical protein
VSEQGPRPPHAGPSAREIGDMLRANAEALGFMLFPAARKIGGYLCVGSLQGERGDKLKIRLSGPKAGTWTDYGTSDNDPKGKGDMLKLLQLTVGDGSIRAAVAEAKRFLNLDSMDPRAMERMRLRAAKAQARAEGDAADLAERNRRNAEGLWQSAAPLTASSPAFQYLAGRGIDFAALGKLPGAIRFHHAVWHAEAGRKLPAMATKMTALDGRHAATHLTFLHYGPAGAAGGGWHKLPPLELADEHGEVSREDLAKKIFGPAWALRAHMALWKGPQRCPLKAIRPGTAVECAEGIEDGLSFAMANQVARVIAAGTLGLIGQLELPAQAGDLNLLAQNDVKPRPIEQLEEAMRAQQAQARAQGSDRLIAQRRPPAAFKDWNDWLRGLPRPDIVGGVV